MNTSHILLHTWQDYLRIIDVDSKQNYFNDFAAVYPGSSTSNTAMLYNSAGHYKRLLSDIVFKKFKNFQLVGLADGIWKVSTVTDILPELTDYIKKKISQYKEDCETSPLEEIDAIEQLEWSDYIEETRDPETLKVTEYRFRDVIPVDSGFLITTKHLAAALWCAVSNFINVSATAPENTVVFTEDGPVVPSDAVNIGELLKAIGFTSSSIMDLSKKISISKKEIEQVHGDPLPYDRSFCVFAPAYSYVDGTTPSCSLAIDGSVQQEEKPAKKASNIYNNKITGATFVSENNLETLKELERVATIEASTKFGQSVIELASGLSITQADIDDLGAICGQLRLLFPEKKSDAPKQSGVNPHEVIQTMYTQSYVNRFKDDTAETNAATVVSQVSQYLAGLMTAHEINKNSISKDIVEMGVKKMRKSHGYVYGMKNPKGEDIIAAISEVHGIGK